MNEAHHINITFQGRDWSSAMPENMPDQFGLIFAGYDLDYGSITVYTTFDDGINHTLAVPAAMCNEEGVPIGERGWRIEPDPELLAKRPDLGRYVGLVYGRILVTAGGHAVDQPVQRQSTNLWSIDVLDKGGNDITTKLTTGKGKSIKPIGNLESLTNDQAKAALGQIIRDRASGAVSDNLLELATMGIDHGLTFGIGTPDGLMVTSTKL